MPNTPHTRLDSWKQIADYLGRDVTTVIRWEKEKGLPVHRVPGGKRHAVFAYPEEIDAWMSSAGVRDSGLGIREAGGLPYQAGAANIAEGRRDGGATTPQTQRTGLRYALGLILVAAIAGLTYFLARPTPVPRVLGYTQLTNDGRLKEGKLVTDGPRLYFTEKTPDGWAIAQVAAAGGEVVPVSSGLTNPSIQDLCLARSELLAIAGAGGFATGQLFALPLSGGLPRRVGNVLARAAAWSPDGQAIAYTAEGAVYVCKADGTEARKIAGLVGDASDIVWHPDGSLLRFTVSDPRSNSNSFWEVRPDGTKRHPALLGRLNAQGISEGAWTVDGRYFVLLSQRKGGRSDLWALGEGHGSAALRRSSLMQLTAGPMGLGYVVPSRDGKRVFSLGSVRRCQLERYDRQSGQFVPYLPEISADFADFSRDGEWMAYMGPPEATLWKRRVNGAEPLQLTLPPMEVELPRWSPDGKWVAFMGREPGKPWKVRVISAAGGIPQTVTSGADQEGAPTWSPDGSRLIFGGLVSPDVRSSGPLVIHLVDLRTHEHSTVPGSEGLWTARWSPSGRYIAALTADSQSLMLFDFSTQKWVKLLTFPLIRDITWSRRKDAIFLTHVPASQGKLSISRLRVWDGKLEEVVSLQGGPESAWLGLMPDDSPLITRDLGAPEIYALDWELP
jgi:Tol biopolymer transport system component